MVSPLLEASFQWGGSQFALGAALQFPSLVATELERTKKFTPAALAEAERFALTDYLTDTRRAGRRPATRPRRSTAASPRLTGLPADVVAKSRGFVRDAYLQHLRADGQTVSPYDATFAMPDPYPGERQRAAAAIRCWTASRARCPAPSSATRATNSASRPT